MRLVSNFSSTETSSRAERPAKRGTKLPKKAKVKKERPHLTPDEIRAKVEAHRLKKASKAMVKPKIISSMPESEADIPAIVKPKIISSMPESEAGVPMQANNPQNPEVRGKLKSLMASGAFSFSEKERAVLGKILKDD